MRFIAHRGLWHTVDEKNTLKALCAAIDRGYGIETDIRDYCGKLVVSHDIADSNSVEAEMLFRYYRERKSDVPLALNVKADGIQKLLIPLLEKYEITNYFLFDMSIPEYVVNVEKGLKSFTRHSDIETDCVMYDKAVGVWMDSFYDNDWLSIEDIKKHVSCKKRVCIVSPELHKREHFLVWADLKKNLTFLMNEVYLCTDMPESAEDYFYGHKDKSSNF